MVEEVIPEEVEEIWEGELTSQMPRVELADGDMQFSAPSVVPPMVIDPPIVASKPSGSTMPRAPADYTLLLP
eukprot:4092270-Amphidinium_carterae.1